MWVRKIRILVSTVVVMFALMFLLVRPLDWNCWRIRLTVLGSCRACARLCGVVLVDLRTCVFYA